MKIKDQTALNIAILELYHDVKNMHNFDNGYANAPDISSYTSSSINIKCKKMMTSFVKAKSENKLPVFFKKMDMSFHFTAMKEIIADYLENLENDDEFDFFLYEIVLILRDYDGHTFNKKTYSESDNNKDNEYYDNDYPVIIELTNTLKNEDPNIFLQKVLEIISQPKDSSLIFSNTYPDVGESNFFEFIYKILVHSLKSNYHEQLLFTQIVEQKTKLPNMDVKILTKNIYKSGGMQSRNNRSRRRQYRKTTTKKRI